jgi:sec-independent protein translocase protein TatA
MTPLAFPLGPTELIIILVIVVLLFGGSRLAGLGKSTGRALKEFKEETSGLRSKPDEDKVEPEKPGTDARATAELEADRAQRPVAEPTNSELRRDA